MQLEKPVRKSKIKVIHELNPITVTKMNQSSHLRGNIHNRTASLVSNHSFSYNLRYIDNSFKIDIENSVKEKF